MCDPLTIAATAAVAAGGLGAAAEFQEGDQALAAAKYNARQQQNEATRTRNVGVEQENLIRRQTAEQIARQRTQLAASGVDINTGSAALLQEDARTLGEADALRVRSNFEDRAVALEQQAEQTIYQGRARLRSSRLRGAGTLLGGASQAARVGG